MQTLERQDEEYLTCQTPITALAMRMRRMTTGSTKAVVLSSPSSNRANTCTKDKEPLRQTKYCKCPPTPATPCGPLTTGTEHSFPFIPTVASLLILTYPFRPIEGLSGHLSVRARMAVLRPVAAEESTGYSETSDLHRRQYENKPDNEPAADDILSNKNQFI